MREILIKNCFSPQSETHTDKLCFSVVLKHFGGNLQRTSHFNPKSDYLRKGHRNTQKVHFFNKFEKGKILRKIWICLNKCFWSNQWNGGNINKNCFSPQSEPHTAKLYFFFVLKHFWGNSQRTSLFSQKRNYLRKEHRITQKVCFSQHVGKG